MSQNRQITTLGGIAIAISMVIGSGLFGLPGLAIQAAGPINALWGWMVVIAIMPAMVHIFSYLGRLYPESEGIALYASMGLGSWSKGGILMLTAGTLLAGMPAFFLVGGSYLASLFSLDASIWTTPFAILLAVFTTITNILGTRQIGWFNSFSVVFILALICFVLMRSMPDIPLLVENFQLENNKSLDIGAIWLAAGIVFWAFQGWENLTFGFGDIKNPAKNIPRIFWASFFIVTLCYFMFAASISAASLAGLPVSGLNGLVTLLPNGPVGKLALILMVIVLIANANSWVFGASRAFYSASKGGVLPAIFGDLNNRNIPVKSLCGALFFYILIIVGIHYFDINEQYAFLATTQGFIILYGGAIIAFTRKTTGFKNRLITIFALIGWFFLAQGFGYLIFYSLFWFAAGCLISKKIV